MVCKANRFINHRPVPLCHSSCKNRGSNLIKHEFLRPDEPPKPGTLVAIDAEFVLMEQVWFYIFLLFGTNLAFFRFLRSGRDRISFWRDEESFATAYRFSLARVSVLRSSGPREGIPSVDDHMHTSEIIVDYLTEFSGVKCESSRLYLRVHCLHNGKNTSRLLWLLWNFPTRSYASWLILDASSWAAVYLKTFVSSVI